MPAERQVDQKCPRCGYEQRGIIATWVGGDHCPLLGTCAECGLTFEWADLLSEHRSPPEWFVEYAPRRQFPPACARTSARSLAPWLLWSRIRMEHAIRWHRVIAYVAIVILVPAILLYTAVQTTLALYVRYQTAAMFDAMQADYQQSLTRLKTIVTNDPATADEHAVTIARLESLIANPVTIQHSYPAAVIEALFLPLQRSSRGRIIAPMGTWPYHSPRDLFSTAASIAGSNMPTGAFVSPWIINRPATDPFRALAAGAVVTLLVPLSMACLPISRRRARVRWKHIGRVAAYSVILPPAILFVVLLLQGGTLVLSSQAGRLAGWAMVTSQFGLLIAAFFWWWMAITRYFRMPRGWLVALVLTGMCTLAISVTLSYIAEDFMMRATQ